jgi:glutamyl-Q tRNA(Asp) synthetase
LVRIEDVDTPRCITGADQLILQQLATCGLVPDAPVVWQSQRCAAYQAALDTLIAKGWAYPCGCSRKEIEDAQTLMGHARERHTAAVYPGTCRDGLKGKAARAWRLNVQRVIDDLKLPTPLTWQDRLLGSQQQDVAQEVGDFVLRRADGLWAYQLAVVVDDAAQGITHIVRGADLTDNTARQIVLQHALGLPTPSYMHTPLVLGKNGEKLSKQNGAETLSVSHPLATLNAAAKVLGLIPCLSTVEAALQRWVKPDETLTSPPANPAACVSAGMTDASAE